MKFIAILFTCAIYASASPLPTHPEIIPLNRELLTQPEYISELAQNLEKEGEAVLKKQEEQANAIKKLRNEYDDNNKKYSNQRESESGQKFTEKYLKPTDRSNNHVDPIENRNFDEIDSGGFPRFNKKRHIENFRLPAHINWKRNFDPIDGSGDFISGGFNRKRNFDPIDAVDFSGFKDSYYDKPNSLYKRNFDEIDRLDFNGFDKRNFDPIDVSGGFANFKRNFDEIDHQSGFSAFSKRDIDPIDAYGFNTLSKRMRSKLYQGKR